MLTASPPRGAVMGQGPPQPHPAAVDAAAHGAELDAEGRRDLLVGSDPRCHRGRRARNPGERVEGGLDLRVEGCRRDLLGAGGRAGQPLGVQGRRRSGSRAAGGPASRKRSVSGAAGLEGAGEKSASEAGRTFLGEVLGAFRCRTGGRPAGTRGQVGAPRSALLSPRLAKAVSHTPSGSQTEAAEPPRRRRGGQSVQAQAHGTINGRPWCRCSRASRFPGNTQGRTTPRRPPDAGGRRSGPPPPTLGPVSAVGPPPGRWHSRRRCDADRFAVETPETVAARERAAHLPGPPPVEPAVGGPWPCWRRASARGRSCRSAAAAAWPACG